MQMEWNEIVKKSKYPLSPKEKANVVLSVMLVWWIGYFGFCIISVLVWHDLLIFPIEDINCIYTFLLCVGWVVTSLFAIPALLFAISVGFRKSRIVQTLGLIGIFVMMGVFLLLMLIAWFGMGDITKEGSALSPYFSIGIVLVVIVLPFLHEHAIRRPLYRHREKQKVIDSMDTM